MTKRKLAALNFHRERDPSRSVEIYGVKTDSFETDEYVVLTDQQLDDLVRWLQTLQRERDEGGAR